MLEQLVDQGCQRVGLIQWNDDWRGGSEVNADAHGGLRFGMGRGERHLSPSAFAENRWSIRAIQPGRWRYAGYCSVHGAGVNATLPDLAWRGGRAEGGDAHRQEE